MVRIKSILAKYAEISGNGEPVIAHPYGGEAENREYGAAEIDLMLTAAKFNDVISHAYQEMAPHKICQYIYETANAFNGFYHANKIMSETDQKKQGEWISLITLVLHVLEACVDILGFKAPERM